MEKQVIYLDTSVLIDFFRKVNKSKSFFYELTKEYDLFAVSAITEYEIYCGSNTDQDLFWDEFFNKVVSLPYSSESALKQKNKKIDIPDLMIAGTAILNNMPLATLNAKHFQLIPELELITRK